MVKISKKLKLEGDDFVLENNELKNINGGAISWTAGIIIGGIFTFIVGIIDGYVRPLACR